jgi:hypothetical protein
VNEGSLHSESDVSFQINAVEQKRNSENQRFGYSEPETLSSPKRTLLTAALGKMQGLNSSPI